jgi:hypothetical protein
LISFIKVLTMMTGEFDLGSYFTWDESEKDHAQFSTQLLFIMFLIFVSIVIANLLIGLTISKTEELFKEAGLFRLEKTVIQVLGVETIFFQPTSGSGILPKKWVKVLNKKSRIFTYLKSMLPSTKSTVVEEQRASPWKVCVRPFGQSHGMTHSKSRKFLDVKASLDTSSSSFDESYAVHVYDDILGGYGSKLSCDLPAWVIGNTLKFLLDQKVNNDNALALAKEIEADLAQHENAKDSLQDLIRQTVTKTQILPKFGRKESVDLEELVRPLTQTPKPSSVESNKRKVSTISTLGQINEEDSTPMSAMTFQFGPSLDNQSFDTDPNLVQSLSKKLEQLQSDMQELKTLILDLKKVQ